MATASDAPIPTSSIQTLTPALEALRRNGASVEPILRAVNVSEAQLSDPELRIPVSVMTRAWEAAYDASGDPAFGLHAAETVPTTHTSLMSYLAATCDTAREAFELGTRYMRIVSEGLEFKLKVVDERSVFSVHLMEDSRIASVTAEFCVALVARFTPRFIVDMSIIDVWFTHAEPSYREEFDRVIGLPCHFEARANALVGPLYTLDASLPGADAELRKVLEEQAKLAFERLPKRHGLADSARRAIITALPRGNPGAESVARTLAISVRTLRRRLEAEGTSHKQLLDEVRCEMAQRALLDGLSPNEVAFMIGYSDTSAFHKAFRRWTGKTPGEFARASQSSRRIR